MIQVNDRYAIDSDKDQWKIMKNRLVKETLEWRPEGFYSTLGAAVRDLGQQMLRGSEYSSMDQLLDNAKEINKLLERSFPQIDG